jgi:hypothetical protein
MITAKKVVELTTVDKGLMIISFLSWSLGVCLQSNTDQTHQNPNPRKISTYIYWANVQ